MDKLRGGPDIPARFFTIALTDRGTGEVWALMNEPKSEHIKLVTPPPAGFRGNIYEAYGGPRLLYREGATIRILVRDGYLGYEIADNLVRTRPLYAPERVRALPSATFFKIVLFAGFRPEKGDVLAYETEVEFS